MAESKTNSLDVKRSVLRVLGLGILSPWLYPLYWFYVTRQQVTRELGTNDNVGLQTLGLIVPILQAFILYWLYRDINEARLKEQLLPFPAKLYCMLPFTFIYGGLALTILLVVVVGNQIPSGTEGLSAIALGLYALSGALVLGGSVFSAGLLLQTVFYCLVVNNLNQYWDVKTKGAAREARLGRGEIVVIVIGLTLIVANVIAGAIGGLSAGLAPSDSSGPPTQSSFLPKSQ